MAKRALVKIRRVPSRLVPPPYAYCTRISMQGKNMGIGETASVAGFPAHRGFTNESPFALAHIYIQRFALSKGKLLMPSIVKIVQYQRKVLGDTCPPRSVCRPLSSSLGWGIPPTYACLLAWSYPIQAPPSLPPSSLSPPPVPLRRLRRRLISTAALSREFGAYRKTVRLYLVQGPFVALRDGPLSVSLLSPPAPPAPLRLLPAAARGPGEVPAGEVLPAEGVHRGRQVGKVDRGTFPCQNSAMEDAQFAHSPFGYACRRSFRTAYGGRDPPAHLQQVNLSYHMRAQHLPCASSHSRRPSSAATSARWATASAPTSAPATRRGTCSSSTRGSRPQSTPQGTCRTWTFTSAEEKKHARTKKTL